MRNGFQLQVLLLAFLLGYSSTSRGEIFEFCDDFKKPRSSQRDPFEERIETERHDFTQSAVTVGRGIVQVESGYSYFYKDEDEEIESAHTGPELLLRVGLSEDIEFRLRWNYAWLFIKDGGEDIGSEDLRYSLKLQMTRQHEGNFIPTSALELRGTAPTGGDDFSTGQADFGIDYIYQWQLTECMTFAGSTGYLENGLGDFGLIPEEPEGENFNVFSQSAVFGFELSELNTMYVEWFGLFSDGLEEDFDISIFNIGIDHYVTEDFVLDIRAGVGLTDDSDDFFTGIGGGFRF